MLTHFECSSLLATSNTIRFFANEMLFRQSSFVAADHGDVASYFKQLALPVGRRGSFVRLCDEKGHPLAALALSRVRARPWVTIHFYWVSFRYDDRTRVHIRRDLVEYSLDWLRDFGYEFSKVSFPVLRQRIDRHFADIPDLNPDLRGRDVRWLIRSREELLASLAKFYLDEELEQSA